MGESVQKVGNLMETIVRESWHLGCEGPSSVVDIATFTEKETERLDRLILLWYLSMKKAGTW